MVSWVPPAWGPHWGLRLSRTGSWGTGQDGAGRAAWPGACSPWLQSPRPRPARLCLLPPPPAPSHCRAFPTALLSAGPPTRGCSFRLTACPLPRLRRSPHPELSALRSRRLLGVLPVPTGRDPTAPALGFLAPEMAPAGVSPPPPCPQAAWLAASPTALRLSAVLLAHLLSPGHPALRGQSDPSDHMASLLDFLLP